MTPDLYYLALTAGLCVIIWIPYIVGVIMTVGMPTAESYRDPDRPGMPNWVKRANRAHLNLVESLPAFAALVLVAHVAGAANGTTATAAMVFFWARVVHAIVMYLGVPYLRTIAFTVGVLASLAIFWQIIT